MSSEYVKVSTITNHLVKERVGGRIAEWVVVYKSGVWNLQKMFMSWPVNAPETNYVFDIGYEGKLIVVGDQHVCFSPREKKVELITGVVQKDRKWAGGAI